MNATTVVHFGAGALGRGMVVPLLHESGCDVVVVDTNEELNRELNRSRSYTLTISDEAPGRRQRQIRIVEALSPATQMDRVSAYLRQARIVTTSVRRDNLIHVARTLAGTWGREDGDGRMVVCCENVEHVGSYFKQLLLERTALTDEQLRRLERVAVPDTIVDRICAADWPDSTAVTSERFYECAVDAAVAPSTGIERIPAIERIERAFARKRLLLNTYADAISFLAGGAGLTYLYEAAQSSAINVLVEPYMRLLQTFLVVEFGCAPAELEEWRNQYKRRLSNAGIPRRLDTVARDFRTKIGLEERFAWPLIRLLERGIDIEPGARFLADLAKVGFALDGGMTGAEQVKAEIGEQWRGTPSGRRLYDLVARHL